ncbi:replication protein A 32 kDa subunit C-like [Hordeum vulgare]|nr:replication protein A 32 kDa subunit C-like [Hordeum vulgare]
MSSRETDVSSTLDDGTWKIDLVRWINEETDARDAAFIQHGVYISVHVNIMGFQAQKHGFSPSIRTVTITASILDRNSLQFHMLHKGKFSVS